MECKCDLHHQLVGDGCDVCNPALALEHARETIDEQQAEIARLRDDIARLRSAAKRVLSEVYSISGDGEMQGLADIVRATFQPNSPNSRSGGGAD